MIEKLDNRKDFIFHSWCLVGEMEKLKDGIEIV